MSIVETRGKVIKTSEYIRNISIELEKLLNDSSQKGNFLDHLKNVVENKHDKNLWEELRNTGMIRAIRNRFDIQQTYPE